MSASHRRVAALVGSVLGLVTCVAGPSAAGAGDGAGDDTSPVTLIDAGDTSFQLQLPASAVAGQTAVIRRTETVRQEADGPGGELASVELTHSQTATVMEVAADGTHVLRSRIDAFEATGDVEVLPVDLELLVGYTFEQSVARDGTFVSGRELESGRDREDPLDYFAGRRLLWMMAYPSEPIGVGAEWAVVLGLPNSTVEVTGPYVFELVELTPDSYTLGIAWDQTIDDMVGGIEVTGTITGSLTLTASTTNVLDESFEFSQHAETEQRRGSDVLTIVIDETFSSVSTPYVRATDAAA